MQLGEQNWKEIGAVAARERVVVVIPLGSMEQHGHHLPVLTDTLIAGEIARRAEAVLDEAEAVFLPPLYLGASDHHLAFPGTVSLKADTYVRVLTDVVESLVECGGFRRLFFLNAHAGNTTPARLALGDLARRYKDRFPDLWLTFASWFAVADAKLAEVTSLAGFLQTKVIHACEWETGMILALQPELVDHARRGDATLYPDFHSRFYAPDYTSGSPVDVARAIDQASPIGAFGYPGAATAEKGELLLQTATEEVVAFVRDFRTWPPCLR